MLERGDVDTPEAQAIQFGVEIDLVDLEREVMKRCPPEIDRLSRVLREWDRQRLVEQSDDLRVAA